jgi:hypothetical protein
MLVVGISAVLTHKGKAVKKLFQSLDFIFIQMLNFLEPLTCNDLGISVSFSLIVLNVFRAFCEDTDIL